jgi:N4-gp56 family major capsid protein
MKHRLINLQLFANANVQTTNLNSSGNDLSPEMKTFYVKTLLENARQEHYFNQFGQAQPLPAHGGNKVEWRKFATYAPATTPLTEGVTPDGNKQNVTTVVATINQYGDYTTVSDRMETEAIDNVVAAVTEEHSAQAADTLERITQNEVLSGTNVIYAGGKTSRDTLVETDTINTSLLNLAASILKKAHAPKINGEYVAIVHTSVAYDLRESDGWIEVNKYADPKNIYNGEIGKLHGIRFIEDPDVKLWKNSEGIAVYPTIVMGANAYGRIEPSAESLEVIVKQPGSAGTADPLNQRGTIGWKATHGAKILYDERIVRIESGSSQNDMDVSNIKP